jgi:hypothetical protein
MNPPDFGFETGTVSSRFTPTDRGAFVGMGFRLPAVGQGLRICFYSRSAVFNPLSRKKFNNNASILRRLIYCLGILKFISIFEG